MEKLAYLNAARVNGELERKGLSVPELAALARCSSDTIYRGLAGRPLRRWTWRRINQALREAPQPDLSTVTGFVTVNS